jgi:exopolysaccharide biosynthesis polyprenyl glycosylphosphotransferase
VDEVGGTPASLDALDPAGRMARSIGRPQQRHLPRGRRLRLVRNALLIADAVGFTLAYLVTQAVTDGGGILGSITGVEYAEAAASLPIWATAAALFKLYDDDRRRIDHSTVDDLVRIFLLVTVGAFVFTRLATPGGPLPEANEAKLTIFWAAAIVLVTATRTAARALVRRRSAYVQNTLIVGAGDVGQRIAHKLLQHPEYRLNPVLLIDGEPKAIGEGLEQVDVAAGLSELPELIRAYDVEHVIVAFSRVPVERTVEVVRQLSDLAVEIEIVPRLFDVVGPNVRIDWLEALPLVCLSQRSPSQRAFMVKRSIDVVGAVLGLVLAAPLFAFIAWRIRRDSPGPVLFRQTRLGRGMREFTILKFRTMRVDTSDEAHRTVIRETMKADAAGGANGLYKANHDDALTRVGRWLRRTSLDELPQLVNVLRGEMSLVGPRPSLPYEIESFEPHHFERFRVAPGLTGLWQVRGRALTTWREAVEMDVTYVRGWSLALDLWLLCRTPAQLVRLKTS